MTTDNTDASDTTPTTEAVGSLVERGVGRLVPERADVAVLAAQVSSLRAALVKVLDTREKEAKAWFAYETARDNYTGGAALESRRHLAMMRAASSAEKEARLLLATLKPPNVRGEPQIAALQEQEDATE